VARHTAVKQSVDRTQPSRQRPGPRKEGSHSFPLDDPQVEAARRALGASSAAEAIRMALDIVLFRPELVDPAARMLGVRVDRTMSRETHKVSSAEDLPREEHLHRAV
jgi:hypothetical protein